MGELERLRAERDCYRDALREIARETGTPCGREAQEALDRVPTPGEPAIERAAKILPMFHPDDAREMVRAIADALEQPE